jgi:folate-binding protein YgfZ
LLSYFQKQIVSDDVAIRDLGACGHLEVHGPLTPDLVAAVLGVDVRGLSADEHVGFPLDRHHLGTAVRLNTFGETGYLVWAEDDRLATVWEALLRLGAAPVGREACDVLRIEAGTPRFGSDMTESTLALEVAPPGSISLTKGCYRGQEVVARGTYVGHMNRRLVGLRIDGDVPPSHGDAVRLEGQGVGTVTSGCWSPTTGWVIALALLQADAAQSSSRLFIDHDGWDLRSVVHPLPFVLGRA